MREGAAEERRMEEADEKTSVETAMNKFLQHITESETDLSWRCSPFHSHPSFFPSEENTLTGKVQLEPIES